MSISFYYTANNRELQRFLKILLAFCQKDFS